MLRQNIAHPDQGGAGYHMRPSAIIVDQLVTRPVVTIVTIDLSIALRLRLSNHQGTTPPVFSCWQYHVPQHTRVTDTIDIFHTLVKEKLISKRGSLTGTTAFLVHESRR